MSFWDKKQTLFRILIAIIGLGFLILVIINFIQITSAKTDQNLFAEPASRFYLTRTVPAEIFDSNKDSLIYFNLQPGNLIVSINDSTPKNLKGLYEFIEQTNNIQKIKITYIDNKKVNPEFMKTGYFVPNTAYILKKDIPQDFIKYLSSAVLIGYIEKDGASERAGLKIGDFIVKVNGESFRSAFEANKVIQDGESGSFLTYEILRDNKIYEYKVEIVRFEIPINSFILFIISIVYICLGFVLAEIRPDSRTARLLGMAFLLIGFYLSALLILRFHRGLNYYMFSLFTLCSAFGIPALIHGMIYFPRMRDDLRKAGWVVKGPYVYGVVFTLTSVINVFWLESLIVNTILSIFIQFAIPLFLLYYFIVLFIYRKSRSKEEAGLSRAINFVFFVLLILAILATIMIIYKIYYLGYAFNMSLILIPLVFIYTIGRYKLLNIDFRIRKNIQYILISALWKLFLISAIILAVWQISQLEYKIPNLHFTGTSIEVLDNPLSPRFQAIYKNISIIIMSICGAFIFNSINKKGQYFLDKKYFRTRFDYRKASTEFSEILSRNIGIDDLAGNIISELAALVHLKKAGIIFYKNEESVVAQNFFGFTGDTIQEYCQITAKQQIFYIREFKSEFRVEYLEQPMRDIYLKCEFLYIIPVRSKDRIVGALLVGDKLSEAPYHREDLEFLNAIAGQISTAIENAFLYDELTHQERIKHELELARRIQLASLPQSIPDIDGLDVSGISVPAHEVGGDFFDYLRRNGELTVIVGDVSGKGTSAALYMSKAQGIMRTLHEFDLSPRELFIRSNQLLYKHMDKSSFITAICANINVENGTIRISRAGHIPLYYFPKNKPEVRVIKPGGIVLGMAKSKLFDLHLEEIEMKINQGDIFLFITDGVMDARNQSGQEFKIDIMHNIVLKNFNKSSEDIRNEILDAIKAFSNDEIQFDDMTIVVIKVL